MDLNEKLQQLRKQKGLTQEELAEVLYVSRTAISKWESGRGYPNIDSLKCIAKYFDVSVDELLSSEEIINVAEQDNKQRQNSLKDLIFGLIDLSFIMLFFLPFFAKRISGVIVEVGLIKLTQINMYLKIAFFVLVVAHVILGTIILSLINLENAKWNKCKRTISIILSVLGVMLFSLSLQPYACVMVFVFLAIKVGVAFKR